MTSLDDSGLSQALMGETPVGTTFATPLQDPPQVEDKPQALSEESPPEDPQPSSFDYPAFNEKFHALFPGVAITSPTQVASLSLQEKQALLQKIDQATSATQSRVIQLRTQVEGLEAQLQNLQDQLFQQYRIHSFEELEASLQKQRQALEEAFMKANQALSSTI